MTPPDHESESNSTTFKAPFVVVLSFLLLVGLIPIGYLYSLVAGQQVQIQEKADKKDVKEQYNELKEALKDVRQGQSELRDFLIEKLGRPSQRNTDAKSVPERPR